MRMRTWEDFRDSGLLWMLNTTVLHPRGLAMSVHYDENGKAIGWSILGDGNEVYVFDEDVAEDGFQKFEATLRNHDLELE